MLVSILLSPSPSFMQSGLPTHGMVVSTFGWAPLFSSILSVNVPTGTLRSVFPRVLNLAK